MNKVAVFGAGSQIGKNAVLLFSQFGYEVIAFVYSKADIDKIPGVEFILVGPNDDSVVEEALEQARIVFLALLFNPNNAQRIIVPEGSNERASEAVTLLNKGYSSSGKIIVSPITQSNSAYYVAAGAPAGSLLNDANATSTYTNARNTLQMMADLGYDSAIITSSDYHMLRTKMIYERQNRHYGFDLTYVASYREIDGKNVQWNEGPSYLKAGGFREIKKFWGYVLFLYHWVDED